MMAGDPKLAEPSKQGNVPGGVAFGAAGRAGVRRAWRALDRDRCVVEAHGQPRLGEHRQQPVAGGRPDHQGGSAFSDLPGRRRADRHRVRAPTARRFSSTSSTRASRPSDIRPATIPRTRRSSAAGPTGRRVRGRARRRSPSGATTAVSSAGDQRGPLRWRSTARGCATVRWRRPAWVARGRRIADRLCR